MGPEFTDDVASAARQANGRREWKWRQEAATPVTAISLTHRNMPFGGGGGSSNTPAPPGFRPRMHVRVCIS